MGSRSGRRGLVWVAFFLLLAGAALDLVRRDSFLRGWWSELRGSRGEETRSMIEQFRRSQPRSRGR